ncbi:MAG: diaminopimelate decarboxylase [Ignavibacteriaceae bacterium]
MKYFDSEYYTYKDNSLYCEEVPVIKIAEEFGTPAYIYSRKYFTDRYKEAESAFKDIKNTIFFACKSNFNLSVINTFVNLGSGVDVNSAGELFRALKAGSKPDKLIMSGVGKTEQEIRLALEYDLLMIKAESEEEIILINEIAGSMNKTARVALRVNPDVDAETHPYISTGLAENKFGVDPVTALKLYRMQKDLKNIIYTGVDMHLGSQITKVDPFVAATEKLAGIFMQLKSEGINLRHIDLGGGIGSAYNNEKTFTVKEYADALIPVIKRLNCDVFLEPGRFFTANSGILAVKVLYTKKTDMKNFLITDGAMNDLLRPSIYSAYHHVQPLIISEGRKEITADVVGPVCESGDFLAKNAALPECKPNDYLAVMSAGAYGMVMASNYNMRRRPPEILVDGNNYKLIRGRENYDHIIFDEEKFL